MSDDMSMGEIFQAMKEESQERRAGYRVSAAESLRRECIEFEAKNTGAHLIVRHKGRVCDFWPGTGLWIFRETKRRGRGFKNLMREVKR